MTQAHPRQSGMVSIMVTMIMMVVVSLIVLGFAQVSRREQRQALDRQLSQQAFLAAESGVNDARDIALRSLASGQKVAEKDSCGPTTDYPVAAANPTIGNDISYTCLLVNTRLDSLVVNPLSINQGSVNIPVEPGSGTIDTLRINWDAINKPASQADITANCKLTGTSYLPGNNGDWECAYGVLRLDIISSDTLSRTSLTNSQKTFFLYPVASGVATSVDYAATNNGVLGVRCVLATGCLINFTNMVSTGSTNYVARLTAIYNSGAVTVAARDSGGATMELKNAQIMIDATGKAQDVLRRIQVRIPIQPSGNTPDYALQSGSSICKRFELTADTFRIPSSIIGQDTNNPTCRPVVILPPPPPGPFCVIPKDIILAIDSSGSMRTEIMNGKSKEQWIKDITSDFVTKTGVSAANNHIGVVTFDSNVRLRSPLISNIPDLQTAIQNYQPTYPYGTTVKNGLILSRDELRSSVQQRSAASKVVILFTDGIPSPAETRQDMIDGGVLMETENINTYVIGLATNALSTRLDVLDGIKNGEGTYTTVRNATELQAVFDQISNLVSC